MKPKRRWFQFSLFTLFIVVTLFGVWLGDRVHPVRRLERQLTAESEEARVLAARKLGAMGSRGKAAEASLARALDDRSSRVRGAAIWAMSRIGGDLQRLVPLLSDSNESIQLAASEAIVWGGGDAAQVMPTLLDRAVVRGPFDSNTSARDLVGAFGPEPAAAAIPFLLTSTIDADPSRATAVKELIEQLPVPAPRALASLIEASRHECAVVRLAAAEQLLRLGPLAKEAAQELRELLRDDDRRVAVMAAAALGAVEPDDPECLFVLKDGLQTNDHSLRLRCINGLMRLAPVAQGACDELFQTLDDDSAEVSMSAADALCRLAPNSVPLLLDCLAHGKTSARRRSAAHALAQIGRIEAAAMPSLISALDDPIESVRHTAAEVLGEFGDDAAPEVPRLLNWLKLDSRTQRCAAVGTLGKIRVLDADGKTQLLAMLSSDDQARRAAAAQVLAACGESPGVVVPALIELAVGEDGEIALQAIESLGQLGPKATLAIEPLAALLASENSVQFGWGAARLVREEAGQALVRIGPVAVGLLVRELSHHDPQVRALAAQALGGIGPAAKAAVPALIDRLDDQAILMIFTGCMGSAREMRFFAIEALGQIGPEASACVGQLVPLLDEPSSVHDHSNSLALVIAALGRLGPSAKDVVPKLASYAGGDDLELAEQACISLARIVPGSDRLMRWLGGFLAAIERESSLESSLRLGDFSELIWELGESARPLAGDLWRIAIVSPMHSPWVRCHAAFALARFPNERAAAISYLEGSARDDHVTDGWLAKDMLETIKAKISQAGDSSLAVGFPIRSAQP